MFAQKCLVCANRVDFALLRQARANMEQRMRENYQTVTAAAGGRAAARAAVATAAAAAAAKALAAAETADATSAASEAAAAAAAKEATAAAAKTTGKSKAKRESGPEKAARALSEARTWRYAGSFLPFYEHLRKFDIAIRCFAWNNIF
jgi:translation initiation factor IF-2